MTPRPYSDPDSARPSLHRLSRSSPNAYSTSTTAFTLPEPPKAEKIRHRIGQSTERTDPHSDKHDMRPPRIPDAECCDSRVLRPIQRYELTRTTCRVNNLIRTTQDRTQQSQEIGWNSPTHQIPKPFERINV